MSSSTIVRRRTIDRNIEQSTLILLITSTKALNTLSPLVQPELFESSHSRKICSWIQNYHQTYKECPGKLIQEIYNSNRSSLSPKDDEEIADFLEILSNRFLEEEEQQNEAYLIEKAERYLKTRVLAQVLKNAQELLEAGNLEQAEAELARKHLPAKVLSNWVSPFDDPEFINLVFDEEEEESFIELGGGLKEFCGNPKRGELWGIMGFTNRGKSWYMMELTNWAIISGQRVAWISLEMADKRFAIRPYMNLTASGKRGEEHRYPVFDCKKNQNNSCQKLDRTSRIPKPREFDPKDDRYLPCTVCREGEEKKDFEAAVWWEIISRPPLTRKQTFKVLEQFGRQYGRNLFKLISFPSSGTNVRGIENALDILEFSENWIPDVIAIDYPDLLKSDDSRLVGRESIDYTWKLLKGMAEARKAWVIAPTRSNREGAEKGLLGETNTAEDIRKLYHTDEFLTVNQTKQEKSQGVIRIGQLKSRWDDFNPTKTLMILQHLKTGQTNLDSTITQYQKNEKRIEEEDE